MLAALPSVARVLAVADGLLAAASDGKAASTKQSDTVFLAEHERLGRVLEGVRTATASLPASRTLRPAVAIAEIARHDAELARIDRLMAVVDPLRRFNSRDAASSSL